MSASDSIGLLYAITTNKNSDKEFNVFIAMNNSTESNSTNSNSLSQHFKLDSFRMPGKRETLE